MLRFLPFILKSVLRKKLRSTLTIVAVALPLFIICIMFTILQSFDEDPSKGRGMYRLVVRHKVSLASTIPEAYREKLLNLPGVKTISVLNWFGGQYVDSSPRNFFSRFFVDPETFLDLFDEAEIARGSAEEWKRTRNSVLVGELLMRRYGWKLGQNIALQGDIYPVDITLKIVATYHAPQEDAIYFHKKYIDEALPARASEVMTFWLKTDSANALETLAPLIYGMFENTPYPIVAETEKEFQNAFLSMLGNVTLLIRSMGSIMAVVILLIVANTMAMSARERVTEIAVLRCLGFQKSTILAMMLAEGSFLTILGGALGLLISAAVLPPFRNYLLTVPGPLSAYANFMRLFPQTVAVIAMITLVVGVFSGLVPALRSAQRTITEGLRQVA